MVVNTTFYNLCWYGSAAMFCVGLCVCFASVISVRYEARLNMNLPSLGCFPRQDTVQWFWDVAMSTESQCSWGQVSFLFVLTPHTAYCVVTRDCPINLMHYCM